MLRTLCIGMDEHQPLSQSVRPSSSCFVLLIIISIIIVMVCPVDVHIQLLLDCFDIR